MPGVMRKRVQMSDRVHASHRLVCTHRSARDRAERRFALDLLQLAKRLRAVFELEQCLLDLDSGDLSDSVRQSAHVVRDQDRMSHCLCA